MENVVFDNPVFYAIDYPGQDAVEIVDKRSGRMGVVRGALAQRFRHDFGIVVAEDRGEEGFEDLIEEYGGVITQAARLH